MNYLESLHDLDSRVPVFITLSLLRYLHNLDFLDPAPVFSSIVFTLHEEVFHMGSQLLSN